MLTPNGQSASKIEKVMLLSLWANSLNDELNLRKESEKRIIFAGIGKPTYPINSNTIKSYLNYWKNLDQMSQKWYENPEGSEEAAAVDYGDPRGDIEPREIMAKVMSSWYESEITPDNILFTVGGIGALRVIFETFNTHYDDIPGYRIITPFPHYSAYSNNPRHRLHPVDVMSVPGYKLKGYALEKSIREAYEQAENDHGLPKAVLLCNPSNPIGTIIDEEDLLQIADVLRRYPDLYIILDEAYAEMAYKPLPSFLKLAPDLKLRTIILRSATKALSAAGERMAVLMVFEQALMNEMLNKNISYFIHAPRSAQVAYAQTMEKFNVVEQKNLSRFYRKKIDYVIMRLHAMGAAMPDPMYDVDATFYVLADFSDLFGLDLPTEIQRVMQKSDKISTGEELAYYLLFNDRVMVSPLSYFGLPTDCGFIRITCSGNDAELRELMDRLEKRLFEARMNKKLLMVEKINQKFPELKLLDGHMHEIMSKKIDAIIHGENSCLILKGKNQVLEKLYTTIVSFLGFISAE
ncbi:MAG: pyridoxal phosphate-dependent aminotransferase [Legionella sp.]|nr:pyridoxal phosphate-dependent aminotransferase [Legionella sp.]